MAVSKKVYYFICDYCKTRNYHNKYTKTKINEFAGLKLKKYCSKCDHRTAHLLKK